MKAESEIFPLKKKKTFTWKTWLLHFHCGHYLWISEKNNKLNWFSDESEAVENFQSDCILWKKYWNTKSSVWTDHPLMILGRPLLNCSSGLEIRSSPTNLQPAKTCRYLWLLLAFSLQISRHEKKKTTLYIFVPSFIKKTHVHMLSDLQLCFLAESLQLWTNAEISNQ